MSQTKAQLVSGTTAQDLTVDNINTTSVNSGQLSNRNKIINGNMKVNQRASSYTSTGSEYTLDRFRHHIGTGFNFDTTTTQSTDSPDGFSNSLKITPDSVVTPSGSQNGVIEHHIEGQDLQDLASGTSSAKQITVSFYAKTSSQNNGHQYGLQLFKFDTAGNNRTQTRSFTVTSSWQRFTFIFTGDTSNDIRNTNTTGVRLIIHLASGPDDIASAKTSWETLSAFMTVTGQSNFMDNTSNEFFITGVQLEVGSTATDFEHRSFGQELALCQRYFCAYGSPIDGISNGSRLGSGISTSSNNAIVTIPTGTKMRANPSGSFSSGVTINDAVAGPDASSVSTTVAYNGHVQVTFVTAASTLTSGNAAHIRFESTSYLHLSAEL
jgi:hypothetical protein